MNIMWLQITSLIYVLLLIIIYFSKPKIKNQVNKIYKTMMISNFFGLLIEIGCFFTVSNMDIIPPLINAIFTKGLLVYYLIWILLFTMYVFEISTDNVKKIRNFEKFFLIIYYIVNCIMIILLPMYYNNSNNEVYSYGPSIDWLSGAYTILIFIWIFILVKKKKEIVSKKYLPIWILIPMAMFVGLIQKNNPALTLTTSLQTLVTFIMYFTIENPDLKMIEQLNIAREQADKANRAKTDFLSSMSHEIRTPLNAIVGFSEMIKTAETMEEAKENANDIVGASQTLLEIVNGILDISKIEAGKIEIHNSAYNAHELFDGIVKLGKGRLGEKPLDYRIHIAEDLPETLYGDHANLKKIVINLLTNAIKYTDHGYVDFSVKCVNTNDVCRLIVSVEDSGRGIKQEDLNKLFTKFQRLDEDRNTTIEGTGLGLAITKQLIELMGGKIVVHSTYGEGSKFTVAIDQKISKEKVASETVEVDDNLDLTGKKILIVDDNKLNLKVASKILEKFHPTIETLESGMECIDKINAGNKYDLILMDDMMPRMNGTETLQRLKQIENFNTPVVILTANAIAGQEQKYLASGFNGYLSKPIDKIKLHEVLTKFLKVKEVKQEEVKESVNQLTSQQPVQSVSQPAVKEESSDLIDLTGKKILIVDDNNLNIKVESKILSAYNPTIDSVLSGEECLNKINETTYDLIFMDDMMPNLSGVETFKKLKEIETFKTPVVILTANAIEGMKEQYLSEGFIDYLSKPIDKSELNRVLKEILGSEGVNDSKIVEEPKKNEQFSSVYVTKEENNKTIEFLKSNNVDIDNSLELLGDIDTYNDTVEEFYNGIKDRIMELKGYKDKNDLENYAILVHAIKSDAKYLGFTKLSELAFNHEMAAKENKSDYILQEFNTLINTLADAMSVVKKYLGK